MWRERQKTQKQIEVPVYVSFVYSKGNALADLLRKVLICLSYVTKKLKILFPIEFIKSEVFLQLWVEGWVAVLRLIGVMFEWDLGEMAVLVVGR